MGYFMYSIKSIAKMAGVSRGTVDRVINDRGGVSPETREHILEILKETGYSPNRFAQSLSIKKKNLKIGVALHGYPEDNPFFGQVSDALYEKVKDLDEFGIKLEIRYTPLNDHDELITAIDELYGSGINALIISPNDAPNIINKINSLAEKGIPIVTLATDIPRSKRLSYVGCNSYRFGMIAGNLMGIFTNGNAKTAIISGSEFSYNHQQKIHGFSDYLMTYYPNSVILDKGINNDREDDSYEIVKRILNNNKEINSVFFAAAGVRGGCQAIKDCGLAGKIAVVTYDLLPETLEMVKKGVISATIGQQPDYLAKKAIDILVEYLGMSIVPNDIYYSNPEIMIKANLI